MKKINPSQGCRLSVQHSRIPYMMMAMIFILMYFSTTSNQKENDKTNIEGAWWLLVGGAASMSTWRWNQSQGRRRRRVTGVGARWRWIDRPNVRYMQRIGGRRRQRCSKQKRRRCSRAAGGHARNQSNSHTKASKLVIRRLTRRCCVYMTAAIVLGAVLIVGAASMERYNTDAVHTSNTVSYEATSELERKGTKFIEAELAKHGNTDGRNTEGCAGIRREESPCTEEVSKVGIYEDRQRRGTYDRFE
jgi:hypothetical protein